MYLTTKIMQASKYQTYGSAEANQEANSHAISDALIKTSSQCPISPECVSRNADVAYFIGVPKCNDTHEN